MDIKGIRKEIAAVIDADAAMTALNVKVYPSRKMPLLLDQELCVYSLGTMPSRTKALGRPSITPEYRIGISWITKFTETTFEAQEDLCEDIEGELYRILLEENYSNSPYWREIIFRNYSDKPLNIVGLQNVHYGRTEAIVKA